MIFDSFNPKIYYLNEQSKYFDDIIKFEYVAKLRVDTQEKTIATNKLLLYATTESIMA